jgi:hypothetical protein
LLLGTSSILNVVVGVTHVKCMLVHNPAPLEIGLVRIVPIPHLLMSSCLEKLVFPCVGSLLEAIGIMETELPPQLNTYLSKVTFRKLLRLIRLCRSLLVTG